MKNNLKKAPVKFREDLLYFQHFMLILSLPQISDYHHLKTATARVHAFSLCSDEFIEKQMFFHWLVSISSSQANTHSFTHTHARTHKFPSADTRTQQTAISHNFRSNMK